MGEEVPHMSTKEEILEKAIEMFKADMIARGLTPITPTEEELKEANWFEAARAELMSGVKSQLEEYLAFLESEAESIRDELGIKPPPPPKTVRELEEQVDSLSGRLDETRRRLRETTEELERLRAVKIPPKVIAAPPEKPTCPAHPGVELVDVSEAQAPEGWTFPWGVVPVPSEMFLFQCPEDFAYYICEPRKRCEFISLDVLRRKLAAIVRPIAPPPIPIRVVPRALVTLERIRAEEAEIQRHEMFDNYLAEMGYTHGEYEVLDALSKDALRKGFREWLIKQPFRKRW